LTLFLAKKQRKLDTCHIQKRASIVVKNNAVCVTLVAKSQKRSTLPEWASQIIALRRQLKMSQGQLAKRMECSAMTVSRWERGMQKPTADYYIQLGRLVGKDKCWFFWEFAGLRMADFARSRRTTQPLVSLASLEKLGVGSGARMSPGAHQKLVALPILPAVAGTHGQRGDKKLSLDMIPPSEFMGAPSDWCPNPRYTRLLRVRGHSMESLISDGDILAVDGLQTDKSELDGKIVLVSHEDHGLCVSRFRRYDTVEVLEAENHEYENVVLGKDPGWRIVGKVLWWISGAP
jgi:SOS-response transcriptional repressor LexA